jgi:NADPH:quinone reductase-like Zn-dependent oxidoreductase
LVTRPPGLSWDVSAALPFAGFTAWTAVEDLGIEKGETILIHAAAGGVGSIATQLAVEQGARVIGTSSPINHDLLRSFGAEPVAHGPGLRDRIADRTDYRVDAVLDASGRDELEMSLDLAGGSTRVLTLASPRAAELGVRYHMPSPDRFGTAMRQVIGLVDAGRVQIPIQRIYPLAETPAALSESREGHSRGKIVIGISD